MQYGSIGLLVYGGWKHKLQKNVYFRFWIGNWNGCSFGGFFLSVTVSLKQQQKWGLFSHVFASMCNGQIKWLFSMKFIVKKINISYLTIGCILSQSSLKLQKYWNNRWITLYLWIYDFVFHSLFCSLDCLFVCVSNDKNSFHLSASKL